LAAIEALLTGHIVALNAVFVRFALRAHVNLGQHLDATERYTRLALKAQSQCRATAETLATIKNPSTVFARQANIAQGPQQVNNMVALTNGTNPDLARAENSKSVQNELLEAHGDRLDARTANATSGSDQGLAPVGALDGPANE
jgi:hypothetical protein